MDIKIALQIRRDYVRKSDGFGQVYLYVRIDKEKDKIQLDLYWPPANLDATSDRLTARHKQDELVGDYNLIIGNALSKANKLFVEYRLQEREVTMAEFLADYHQYEKRRDFISYMEADISDRLARKKIAVGTAKSHRNTLNWMKDYRKTIPFKDIDRRFIEKFEAWLQRQPQKKYPDRKMSDNHIANHMKFFHAYLERAITKGKIPIKNPFAESDVNRVNERPDIDFLMPAHVAELMRIYDNEPLTIPEKLTLCRYLISCQLSLRISDVLALTRKKINSFLLTRRLIFHPIKQMKTKRKKTIYLPIDDVTFGYMEDCLRLQHEAELENLKVSEAYGRKVLAKFAHRLGLDHKMGFHSARHTFGTNFIRAGGLVHNLQQIMGHTKLETTMIYVHVVEDDKDEEMLQLTNFYQKFRQVA